MVCKMGKKTAILSNFLVARHPPVRTYGSSFHGLRFAKRISVGKLCSGNFGLRKMSPVEGRMSQLMGESLGDHLLVRGVFV